MKRGQTDTRKPGRTGTGRIEKACTHLSGILIPRKSSVPFEQKNRYSPTGQ